jgi:hypothetical protein
MGVMPDPRGAKRLLPLGCNVKFKKTSIKVPIQIKEPDDFKPGTHYPKLVDRKVWLVNITMPKELMNDIREGSIDLAGQNIDLEDLDDAYAQDYDTDNLKDYENEEGAEQSPGGAPGGAPDMGMGAPGGLGI